MTFPVTSMRQQSAKRLRNLYCLPLFLSSTFASRSLCPSLPPTRSMLFLSIPFQHTTSPPLSLNLSHSLYLLSPSRCFFSLSHHKSVTLFRVLYTSLSHTTHATKSSRSYSLCLCLSPSLYLGTLIPNQASALRKLSLLDCNSRGWQFTRTAYDKPQSDFFKDISDAVNTPLDHVYKLVLILPLLLLLLQLLLLLLMLLLLLLRPLQLLLPLTIQGFTKRDPPEKTQSHPTPTRSLQRHSNTSGRLSAP